MKKRCQLSLLLIICAVFASHLCARLSAQEANKLTNPPLAAPILKVFSLQNASADECQRILKQLEPNAKIVADLRTNSLIIESTNEDQVQKLEALLLRLDEQPTDPNRIAKNPTPGTDAGISVDSGNRPLGIAPATMEIPNNPAARQLFDELIKHEARAVALAEQLRSPSDDPEKYASALEPVRKELDSVLTQALTIKFKLEQLQLAALEERITRLKTRIGQRSTSMKQIVERRARELIEGDALKWSTPEVVPSATRPTPGDPLVANPPVDDEKLPTESIPGASGSDVTRSTQNARGGGLTTQDDGSSSAFPLMSYRQLIAAFGSMDRNVVEAEEKLKRMSMAMGSLPKDDRKQAQHSIEIAKQERKGLIDEYAAMMKDLELQISEATSNFDTAAVKAKAVENLQSKGVVSHHEVNGAQNQLTKARVALERLKVKNELYKKAGESFNLNGREKADPSIAKVEPTPTPDTNPVRSGRSGRPLPDSWVSMMTSQGATVETSVPKTTEESVTIFRNSSTTPRQVQIALRAIPDLRSLENHTVDDDVALCAGLMVAIDRMNPTLPTNKTAGSSRDGLKPLYGELWEAQKQFTPSVQIGAFIKTLREPAASEQKVALGLISPLLKFANEPQFPELCGLLLDLASSPDADTRIGSLKLLVETLSLTNLDPSSFQSEDRRQMLARLNKCVPRDLVFTRLKSSLDGKSVTSALATASLVTHSLNHAAEDDLIKKLTRQTIDILSQIVQGEFQRKAVSSTQRRQALDQLTTFQSHSDEIVPILIKLLQSDNSEIVFKNGIAANPEDFSRAAVVLALERFGQNARAALPLLQDELVLFRVRENDQKPTDPISQQILYQTGRRLLETISRIEGDIK